MSNLTLVFLWFGSQVELYIKKNKISKYTFWLFDQIQIDLFLIITLLERPYWVFATFGSSFTLHDHVSVSFRSAANLFPVPHCVVGVETGAKKRTGIRVQLVIEDGRGGMVLPSLAPMAFKLFPRLRLPQHTRRNKRAKWTLGANTSTERVWRNF